MRPVLVFRTRWSRPVSVLVWAACAVAAAAVLRDPSAAMVTALLAIGAGALGAWALWWRPAVVVSDGGLTLVGVVTDVHVPWPAVTGVESRGSLRVAAAGRTYSSWAMPSPGGTGVRLRAARKGSAPADAEPAEELPPAEDGSAQEVRVPGDADTVVRAVELRMDRLRAAGHLGRPDPRQAPTRTLHLPVVLGAGGLLLGLLATRLV